MKMRHNFAIVNMLGMTAGLSNAVADGYPHLSYSLRAVSLLCSITSAAIAREAGERRTEGYSLFGAFVETMAMIYSPGSARVCWPAAVSQARNIMKLPELTIQPRSKDSALKNN